MTKTEIIATVVLCTLGCLLLSALGWLMGWTDSLQEAAYDWATLSVATSAVVVIWTYRDKRKKNKDNN